LANAYHNAKANTTQITAMTAEEVVGPFEASGISCYELWGNNQKISSYSGKESEKANIPFTAVVMYSMRDFPGS
jgi:hypothetical protein